MPKLKRLFWDIETAPCIGWFWKPGYNINVSYQNVIKESAIICICYKWEGESEVHNLRWGHWKDATLLKRFAKVANKADELVAHNGDKFDLPWVNARNVINGLDPLPEYKTVDTLVIARRRFRFNSNRLDYLAKVLGVGRKIKTGQGAELWEKVCFKKDPKALDKMVAYCAGDCRILERVFEKLAPYHKPKTHVGVMMDRRKDTCPQCASRNVSFQKRSVTTAGSVRVNLRCNSCRRYFTVAEQHTELGQD